MNRADIEAFANNEVVYIKGQNLVNRNRVSAKKEAGKGNNYVGKAFDDNGSCYDLSFTIENHQVTKSSCQCSMSKPCFHMVACLIKLFISDKKRNSTSNSDKKVNTTYRAHLNRLNKKSENKAQKETWKKGGIQFTFIKKADCLGKWVYQFALFLVSDKNKTITSECGSQIFDGYKPGDVNSYLRLIKSNGSEVQVNASAFNQLDLEILNFLLKDEHKPNEKAIKKTRTDDINLFWIHEDTIKKLNAYLRTQYDLKSNVELKHYLESHSQSFRMIPDNDAKRILFCKIKNDKYTVVVQIKQDNRWHSLEQIDADDNYRLVWADPAIPFWNNTYDFDRISLSDSSFPSCCMFYNNAGINQFLYTEDGTTPKNIFDRYPKTSIKLNYASRFKIFDNKIKYTYPGKPSFSVMASEDDPRTNSKRLFLYEKAVINALVDMQVDSSRPFFRNKKISSMKMSDLKNIIEFYKNFKQSDIVEYEVSENLITEAEVPFDFGFFKEIKFENQKLMINCPEYDFAIHDLKTIVSDYLKGREVYIGPKSFFNLKKESNRTFCKFWSRFDFYNAQSPRPGVYLFPKYRVFDLLLAFDNDVELLKKHTSKEIYELVVSLGSHKFKSFEVPAAFKNILRPYQVEGYQWLKLLEHYGFGGVLADDMGLGKTIQMLSAMYETHSRDDSMPSLVVAPTSLIHNWESECKKYAPSLKITVIEGSSSQRKKLILKNKHGLEITSYALFRRDLCYHKEKRYRFLVIDEAQNIKNHRTNLSSSVKTIDAENRFVLTGTPLVNNVIELWSIFDFILPGLFGSSNEFVIDYEKAIIKNNNEDLMDRLKQKINTFILRRTKQNVLSELPLKTQKDLMIDFSPEHKKFYDRWFEQSRSALESIIDETNSKNKKIIQNKIRMNALRFITELRQICCSPNIKDETFEGENTKLDTCLDLILQAMANNRKVLVFTQFLGMIKILQEELTKRKIKNFVLSGNTPKDDRVAMVDKFNKDAEPSVFISTLQTGGVGLNLVGAEIVIHYDLWWNLAVQNQATDRVHRIGQTKPVNVYRIIINDSIEKRIIEIQERKRILLKNLIADNENMLGQLPLDDLINLFNLKLPD